jgi:hypothetical protein
LSPPIPACDTEEIHEFGVILTVTSNNDRSGLTEYFPSNFLDCGSDLVDQPYSESLILTCGIRPLQRDYISGCPQSLNPDTDETKSRKIIESIFGKQNCAHDYDLLPHTSSSAEKGDIAFQSKIAISRKQQHHVKLKLSWQPPRETLIRSGSERRRIWAFSCNSPGSETQ